MGRVKLKMQTLESTGNRQVTYSKRRSGIIKKARELSILCGIDIILLMFAPNGRPTMFSGVHSKVDEVITKFAQLSPYERLKRKMESLEGLKKTFQKLDHDVELQDFMGASDTVEDVKERIRMLRSQLADVHKRSRIWSDPEKSNTIGDLRQMEDSLVESLHCIRIHKFGKCRFMLQDSGVQFDNELHLRPSMGGTQETQTPSWFPNGEQEHAAVEELKFLPHGDVECSRDASLSNYCGFFGIGKQADFDNAEQVDDQRQVGDALDELSSTQHLRPLNEKCSCHLCSTLNFPEVEKPAETDLPVSPSGYKVDRTFEVPGPV